MAEIDMKKRLNTEIREDILRDLLRHKFSEEYVELVCRRAALAKRMHDRTYAKIAGQMNQLPEGWLPTSKSVTVKFGESYTSLNFNGEWPARYSTQVHWACQPVGWNNPHVQRRIRASDNDRCMMVLDADDKDSEEFHELEQWTKSLQDRVQYARKQIWAALSKVYTVRQLLEAWPEVKPFVKDLAPTKPKEPSVPQLAVAELNSLAGLPVEEKS
jgi:hypothetical protein